MGNPVICWDMNGTILNEEITSEFAELKRENGIKYKTSEISYEEEAHSRTINCFWEITPRRDISAALEMLISSGFRNIITTNASNNIEIERVLAALDLRKYFAGIYCVATGRFGKDYSFALQQQGLSECEILKKAIAVGNEYVRDCPINPLGMPLVLDTRHFYESSSLDVALVIAEIFGAGEGDFTRGFKRVFSNKSSKLNLSLSENVDSRSERSGGLVIPVVKMM